MWSKKTSAWPSSTTSSAASAATSPSRWRSLRTWTRCSSVSIRSAGTSTAGRLPQDELGQHSSDLAFASATGGVCISDSAAKSSTRRTRTSSSVNCWCPQFNHFYRIGCSREKKLTDAVIRRCPNCNLVFVKEPDPEGKRYCNKMTCRCGLTQCYICRKTGIDYKHFCQYVSHSLSHVEKVATRAAHI